MSFRTFWISGVGGSDSVVSLEKKGGDDERMR